MASLKIKLDDQTYEIDPDKLTLGEARILKRDYGMATLGQLNFGDPDQMVGILAIAVKRSNPALTDADVVAKVEGLDFVTVIESLTDEDEEAEESKDPPVAVEESAPAEEQPDDGSANGLPETTPAPSGTPA